MGRIAIIIAVSYGILGGVGVIAIGLLVWSSSRGRNRHTNLHKPAEKPTDRKDWLPL